MRRYPEISDALIGSHGMTSWSDVDLPEQDTAKMNPFRRTAGGVGGYHPSFERQHVELVAKPEAHPVTM